MKSVNNLKLNLKNIPGWRSKRKIVVFESDDWGSNRISSEESFQKLVNAGILNDNNLYNKYDTIERGKDLEKLFKVLRSVTDKNKRHAVFTPFVNVANPDFEKIKAGNFEKYFYENFYETLEYYGERKAVSALYNEGINSKIFLPEFHGREHVCVNLWLKYLRQKNQDVLRSFEERFYAVPVEKLNSNVSSFRPTFYYENPDELPFLEKSITEGVEIFKSLFGYQPKVFDPPNGVFPPVLESVIKNSGIETIVANRIRIEPDGEGGVNKKFIKFGSENEIGLRYYVRNCQFEPYDNRSTDHCLRMIKAAFRWGKPAIICSHRLNFNGGINPQFRDQNLLKLKDLLNQMIEKWPDIEFMSSGELSSVMNNQEKNEE